VAIFQRRTYGNGAGKGTVATTMTQLTVGDAAPDFTASTDTGTFTLSEHRGQNTILYFYPQAMTPGCTTQACDFRDSLDRLDAAGYTVVGISSDDPATLAEFRAQEGLTFTLVSDPDKSIQNAYGAWGEKSLYGKAVVGSIRSTVVVDGEGKVSAAFYNVKATGHVQRLRRELGLD
jgi:peroxiredoxin Q/BCP